MPATVPDFLIHATFGAKVQQPSAGAWKLSLLPEANGVYRCAQIDDYFHKARLRFHWQAPVRLSLRARISSANPPGTWGFGLWNDPFTFNLGLGGAVRRLPSLPNTVWFFYASPPNYLSLRDDLPAQGFLAATFRAPRLPSPLLALAAPFLPLLGWPWSARRLRPVGRWLIKQDATRVAVDPTQWHTYTITWQADSVLFQNDDQEILATKVSPLGALGLVLWIDNQYAAFTSQGSLRFGRLPIPEPVSLDLTDIKLEPV